MSFASNQTQTSSACVSLRAAVVDVALDSALSRLAHLAAVAVVLAVAILQTETNLVALAATVAWYHRPCAAYESVAVVVRRTAALSRVIHDSAAGALAACFSALARISASVVNAGLIVRARIVAPAANVANTILAYLIGGAVVVAVADSLAVTALATLVAQAVRVTPARRVAQARVTGVSRRAVGLRVAG